MAVGEVSKEASIGTKPKTIKTPSKIIFTVEVASKEQSTAM